MTITTDSFRQTEAMLTAAALPSADVLMSIIGLALETMPPNPLPGEVKEPEPITLSLPILADRLGWDHREATYLLHHANEEAQTGFGFALCDIEVDESVAEHVEQNRNGVDLRSMPMRVTVSTTLAAILCGTALTVVAAGDPRAMTVDTASSAMVALVSRIAAVGGGLLYREADIADERIAELTATAATIAAHPALVGDVVMHGRFGGGYVPMPAEAAIIAAVLHGAGVVITTDELLKSPPSTRDDADDGYEEAPAPRVGWSSLTSDGVQMTKLLPHAPLAVIVPIPRDAVLPPCAAAAFVTAIGPLRRDRAAASATLRDMADGRLSEAVADRIIDVWDGRPEHARVSLSAISRLFDAPLQPASALKSRKPGSSHGKTSVAYSTLAEAMAVGITPHVWAPTALQPKAAPAVFHRELFRCEPDASILFSERMREEAGIRIMLLGPPGTGKSAAAAYIASSVLGMATYDVKMSDVLHYRLGALERAIAAAFQVARERHAVLILDEADSIAQDRMAASPGAAHLVTATTNQLLLEMDRHPLPIVIASNFASRIDPAVKRRVDLTFEVQPIPVDLEHTAMRLLLDLDPPGNFDGFGGDTVIADYAGSRRVLRLQGGGAEAAVAAVKRARDVRLGRHDEGKRRIGF